MAVNPNWPLVFDQVAFVGDPNDPNSAVTYTDLTARVRSFESSRGRQYEIDQNQTGEAHLTVSDKDEVLNPANTGAPAPYAGNIKPYRRYLRQAMWPPAPVGAAVNLLNATSGYDPSFETTAVGGVPPNMLTFGTNPTVVAANPFAGANSLQWSVAGSSAEQVTGFTIACIPGQQYTTSVYVRQTAANKTEVFINGGAAGTSTTTTAAYVRLTVTYTATQPTHQFFVGSYTPTLASTVNIDAVQHEPGATASAFATSGPVIYTPFAGYVERWPSSWMHQGTYGMAVLACVDAMAVLAGTDMHTEYRNSILAKSPDYYWPLGEAQGATRFGEVSGNNGPPLVRTDSVYGPAPTYTAGTQTNIAGDPGGSGVQVAGNSGIANSPWTVLQTGAPGTPQISLGGAPPVAFTVSAWVAHSALTNSGGQFLNISDASFTNNIQGFWSTPSNISNNFWSGSNSASTAGTDTWADTKMHLFVLTVNIGASTAQAKLYVDGTLVSTGAAVSTTGWYPPYNLTRVQIAGALSNTGYVDTGLPNGVYAHLGLWKRELSAQDVTDLWTAGKGYPGEGSGARIQRYLTIGGYTGAYALDPGQSLMGPGTVTEGAALLDACQQVTLSENGNLYVEGGSVIFKSRTDRYLKTTATWVFGENQAGGEYPYEGDISFDFDPSRVVNDVTVSRVGGAQSHVSDLPSQKQFFRRSYLRTISIQSDLETIDAANWILNKGKQPVQRVSRLSIRPSANPALWPVALGVRIGDRVTVKRRTTAFTGSADYFVEKVEHHNEPGSWVTTFQMSPAVGYQVWILGQGRLDIDAVLGY